LHRVRGFFSTHGIVGIVFWQIDGAVQQGLKAWCPIAQMNPHHTVVDLPAIAIPLPTDTDRFLAALGRA
jgi:hypothetical protein